MTKDKVQRKTAFENICILDAHYRGMKAIAPIDITSARKSIEETYGLYGKDLRIISRLFNIYPGGLSLNRISDVVLTGKKQACHILDSLEKRRFIQKIDSSSDCYSMHEDAYNAICGNKPFGLQEEIDYIKELRFADLEDPEWLSDFIERLKSNKDSPFSKGWFSLNVLDLSLKEIGALCFLLRHFICHFTEPFTEKKSVALIQTFVDNREDKTCSVPAGFDSLVKRGLAIVENDGYIISPTVAATLLHGQDEIVSYDEIAQRTVVIKSGEIKKKNLFFSPESREEIDNLRSILSKEGFEHACSILYKKKRNPAIQSLLWGSPGTGKTEVVKQIALETGRDIFLFDIARVLGYEWGLTEKLYRRMFLTYRYIVAVKSVTPILFINEADQILSKRLSNLNRAMDKAENTISNLLLQELEDMSGILLATTNSIEILDEAFDRRFLFKTELQKPDAKARKAIWISMIPELPETDAESLADRFEMSGAQISNVAAKRDLAELYYRGERGVSYIEMLCIKELSTENQGPTNKRIGF